MKIGILEPDNFCQEAMGRLAMLGEVCLYSGASLERFLAAVDVIFIRLAHQIDAGFLAKAPKLRVICSPTTGHTHIDETELSKRGIRLISLRGEVEFLKTIRATPEHTFGLILALLRNYKSAVLQVSNGVWDRDRLRGEELFGMAVGIIGMGRVGSRVAEYCSAFGARIHYFDIKDIVVTNSSWRREAGVLPMIANCRVIVLCASHKNGEPPCIGDEEIAALAGKYFVNTARGELVNENILVQAINDGVFAGVALDVVSHENNPDSLKKWRDISYRSDVLITPHIAGATTTSMAKTERHIVHLLQSFIKENHEYKQL
ncbi:hypothetical protein EUZ85_13405 [Hahella sp. KA22]|uniref:NAD(P)-dependent oxidoreductase n=1 Tax=Hahella sp. KA22 TaxID=1628392 RepID=UPI000FDF0180|nr:NAD(P)-dependent oxidoreductase [Hahella sp. KA22]AZZ91672.1 hypothetical protein ENC22_10845 [Hahella sp. KA22]QAY55042.1 hypothetical protein EUZ85_13405 [Hahella sp. KA22]